MLTSYKFNLPLISALIAIPSFAAISPNQEWVRLRDGTRLMTFVYADTGNGPRPVVMARTPYAVTDGKINSAMLDGTAQYFLDRGYNFVVQAVRGTPPSEGAYAIFNPQEIEDARDTMDWIAGQPICNGRIAAVGTSYEGYTALAAAATNHPNLKVVFAGGSPSGFGLHTFQSQGLIMTQLLDYARYNYLHIGKAYDPTIRQQLMLPAIFNEPDPKKYDDILYGKDIPDWNEMAKNFNNPNARIWRDRTIRKRLTEIQVPTFHVAGARNDADNVDVISNFKLIERSSPYRDRHHLLVGQWNHGNSTPYMNGSNLSPYMAERFDSLLGHFMKNTPSPYLNEGRIQWELSPKGIVIKSDDFPLAGSQKETMFFHQNAMADFNAPTSDEMPTKYSYLPISPTLTATEMASFTYIAKSEETLVGEFTMRLFVRSDRPVTDVALLTSIERASGEKDALAYCVLGGKIFGANSVHRLDSGDCPIDTHLSPGDKLTFTIASKLYPSMFRVYELDENGKYVFRDGTVEILHTKGHPSSVSWYRLNPSNITPVASASAQR